MDRFRIDGHRVAQLRIGRLENSLSPTPIFQEEVDIKKHNPSCLAWWSLHKKTVWWKFGEFLLIHAAHTQFPRADLPASLMYLSDCSNAYPYHQLNIISWACDIIVITEPTKGVTGNPSKPGDPLLALVPESRGCFLGTLCPSGLVPTVSAVAS